MECLLQPILAADVVVFDPDAWASAGDHPIARKIAVLFYNTLWHGMSNADPGATSYEDRYAQHSTIAALQPL